jgi:peptidylprolyl isomerase
MSQAKDGDTVKVHYTGRLENGEVFGTTKDEEPLELTLGSGKIIPGFEKGIAGMEVGDTKTITVPPGEAYGQRIKELIVDIKKTDLPEDITPAIGKQLQIRQKDGNPIEVAITDMDEDTVTLDANHPLAGNTLLFEVELLEIA